MRARLQGMSSFCSGDRSRGASSGQSRPRVLLADRVQTRGGELNPKRSRVRGVGLGNLVLAVGLGVFACNSPSNPSQAATKSSPENPMHPAAAKPEADAQPQAQAPAEPQNKAVGAQTPDEKAQAARGEAKPQNLKPASSDKGAKLAPTDKTKESAETSKQAANTQKKVLIMGDSLVATAIGVLLEKELDAHPQVDCVRKAKSATGLARPDYYDWMKQAKAQVQKHRPDLVVMVIGGNDGQDLRDAKASKHRVSWKSDAWAKSYEQRVVDFIDVIRGANPEGGTRVLWLGLPRTETKRFEKKLETIRAAQKRAIDQRSAIAHYRETSSLVLNKKGEVLKSVRHGAKNGKLRESDGIHFTMHGSRYFAHRLFPMVLNELGMRDVQK